MPEDKNIRRPGPNGKTLVFPEGTTEQEISEYLSQFNKPKTNQYPASPSGAGFFERLKLGFAREGQHKQIYDYLSKNYGKENVHYGTGKWWIRKSPQERFQPVSGEGMSSYLGDIAASAGEVLPLVGGTIGGMVGSLPMFVNPPLGVSASAFARPALAGMGGALGEAANKTISRGIWGPEEGTNIATDVADIGGAGLGMATGETVGMAGEKLVGGLGNLISKKVLSPFASKVDQRVFDIAIANKLPIPLPDEMSSSTTVDKLMGFLKSSFGGSTPIAKSVENRFPEFKNVLMQKIQQEGRLLENQTIGELYGDVFHNVYKTRLGKGGIADVLYAKPQGILESKFPKLSIRTGEGVKQVPAINMAGIQYRASELANELSDISPIKKTLATIGGKGAPENLLIPFQELENLRSDLSGMTVHKEGQSTKATRLATQMVKEIDKTIETQAKGYGASELISSLQKARTFYAKSADLLKEGIIPKLAEMEPDKAAKEIMKISSPNQIRKVRSIINQDNPALWNDIKARIMAEDFMSPRMQTFNPAGGESLAGTTIAKRIGLIQPETERAIFTPEEVKLRNDLAYYLNRVNIGGLKGGSAQSNIVLSKIATATGFGMVGLAASGGLGEGVPRNVGLMVGGGLMGIYLGPKLLAKMVLSPTGRALLTIGMKYGGRGKLSARFMSRFAGFIAKPEFAQDVQESLEIYKQLKSNYQINDTTATPPANIIR